MRYYLSNLTIPQIPLESPLLTSDKTMQLILTDSGIIHLNGDKMYDYKLTITPKAMTIENYIDNNNLIISGHTMTKKSQIMQIPIHYKSIIVYQKRYKLHEKSKTSFFIEKIDKKVRDFYFESSYNHDNKFLKKDIISFLSHFK